MSASDDRPRFLGRTYGYTASSFAGADPLEAVDPETQQEQTRAAHAAWAKAQQRGGGAASKAIEDALDAFHGNGATLDRRLELAGWERPTW